MADVVCLRLSSCSDAESARQRSVLAGHLECEQLTARRRFLSSLLALLSAPVWVMAVWPRLLDGPDRRFLLYLFGFLLVLSIGAVIEEWRAIGRLRKELAWAPGSVEDGLASRAPETRLPRSASSSDTSE
jgi:hypothetical protein